MNLGRGESISKEVVQVKKITCTNDFYDQIGNISIVWWGLYSLTGKKIYEISNINKEVDIINLSDRNIYYIYPGTKILLNANSLETAMVSSEVYIEYAPDSNLTAHFTFKGDFGDYELVYDGTW